MYIIQIQYTIYNTKYIKHSRGITNITIYYLLLLFNRKVKSQYANQQKNLKIRTFNKICEG